MDASQLNRLAEENRVKLELVRGIGTWEALPTKRHQGTVFRIQSSIAPIPGVGGCDCVHYSDVLIRFAADTYKRPDIAIFCSEPAEEDEAITQIPAAVVEVISVGYEAKDLDQAPPLYLMYGVQDVLIVDPRSGLVLHHRREGVQRLTAPATIDLECGCRLSV